MATARSSRLSPLSTLVTFVALSALAASYLVSLHYRMPTPITVDSINNVAVFNERKALDMIRSFAEDDRGEPKYRIVGTKDFDDSECVHFSVLVV